MADNVVLNPGTGGATVATDEIGGVQHQRVKIQHGVDGSATDVSSSSPLPVDQQAPLPAGDNNIGNVDIASALPAGANNIGDVDVLSVVPGTGATNLGKAEDAAHASGDVGVLMLAVRSDAGFVADTDGDYTALNTNSGGSLRVTGSVQGNIDHDSAVGTDNPVMAAGIAQDNDDTAPTNRVSAENDVTRLATTRDGALHTVPHPPQSWDFSEEYTTQQTADVLHAAPGAGLSLYITDIYFAADGAVDITVHDEDDILLWKYYAQAAGDGVSKEFRKAKKLVANKALEATTSGAVTCTLVVCGYTAP